MDVDGDGEVDVDVDVDVNINVDREAPTGKRMSFLRSLSVV